METLSDEQFVRGLQISKICTNKGWKHSTEMLIANAIAKSENKEEVISKIENIIMAFTEEESIIMFDKILRHH